MVPHELSGVDKDKEGMPGHPIATAVQVRIVSGGVDDNDEGDNEEAEAAGVALADNVLKVPNKELHDVLMRQKSMAFSIPDHAPPSGMHQQAVEEATVNGFPESKLKAVVHNLQNNSQLIGSMNYRFKEYRNVFLGTHFCDWAIREGYAEDRRFAVELGQACIDFKLIVPYIAGHDVFEDVPAFFRVRGNRQEDEEAPDDSEWSKMFSTKKKVDSNKDVNNMSEQGPQFKLVLSRVCIQWTFETREVINEWFTLLTLATRQHQRPKHPPVVPEPPRQGAWQPRNIDLPDLTSERGPGVYAVATPTTTGGNGCEPYGGFLSRDLSDTGSSLESIMCVCKPPPAQ